MINNDPNPFRVDETHPIPEAWNGPWPLRQDLSLVITFEGMEPPRDTHQSRVRIFRNKAGKVFIGKRAASRETRDFLNGLSAAILAAKRKEPQKVSALQAGPVRLGLGLYYPWPKATAKAKAARTHFKTTRPDADNMVKTIQDGLAVRGLIQDDSQIALLDVRKYYCPTPGVLLVIEPLS